MNKRKVDNVITQEIKFQLTTVIDKLRKTKEFALDYHEFKIADEILKIINKLKTLSVTEGKLKLETNESTKKRN